MKQSVHNKDQRWSGGGGDKEDINKAESVGRGFGEEGGCSVGAVLRVFSKGATYSKKRILASDAVQAKSVKSGFIQSKNTSPN